MDNWRGSQSRIPSAYTKGIDRTQGFIQKAIEGQANYEAAMSDPTVLHRRAEKLAASSDEVWKQGAKQKGAKNIVAGMKLADQKMSSGMAKNLATIQGVSIPPRTRDPMQNIDNRLKPIAEALHRQKMGGS